MDRAILVYLLTILSMFFTSLRVGTRITENLLPEYDYIVVGAGSAGAVMANRLSENPHDNVLLLEAGGDDAGNLLMMVPVLFLFNQKTEDDWGFVTVPQQFSHTDRLNHVSTWPRGKVLGGSSNFNANIYVRGSRHDYNRWVKSYGCHGWSYKEVLPYFLKSENVMVNHLKGSPYHSVGGELPVSINYVTTLSDVFEAAGHELGYPTVDYNGPSMIGVSRIQGTIEEGIRGSTSKSFLRPVMFRRNLHISIHSQVTRILLNEKNVAVGVEMYKEGRVQIIRARKEVILSAGAVSSPHILMHSGIGPRHHLESLGIPVRADLPVGNNLQDHLFMSVDSLTNMTDLFDDPALFMPSTFLKYFKNGGGWLGNTGTATDTAFFQLDDKLRMQWPGLPDIQFIVLASPFDSNINEVMELLPPKPEIADDLMRKRDAAMGRQGFDITICQLHPRSVGTLRLRSNDPFDKPIIDPRYLEDPYDMFIYLRGVRKALAFMNTRAMRSVGADPYDVNRRHPVCKYKFPFDSDDYWACVIRAKAITIWHPTSTCRMGPADDINSVVDTELRVKGVANLRVVDASVMPRITAGNINAVTIMIAEKAADIIRGIDSVAHLRKRAFYL